jgi:glycosyltransferase involved in cell wall biosynthesis
MAGIVAHDDSGLPRVLFLGDVPVEASHHGSALLYRLFQDYPPAKLRIIESDLARSEPARRLPGVSYATLRTGFQRLLNTRFHRIYSSWLTASAPGRVRRAAALLGPFQPEAIVTVGHGYGWLTAASLARRLDVPMHLIVHDDWPRVPTVVRPLARWLDSRFGAVYRQARTRLCVSPFMAEAYERRYGVAGSNLYPSRAPNGPVFEARAPRDLSHGEPLVVGYGGNSYPGTIACLKDIAPALARANARLEIYGPFDERTRRELLAASPAMSFRGMVPYDEMILRLRADADVLFMPMTFEEEARDNMIVSFPSKLADYTATGLPLLIYGPSYCSGVRWARAHGVDEVVDVRGVAGLAEALDRLRSDRDRRLRLAHQALRAGGECFSPRLAHDRLRAALQS